MKKFLSIGQIINIHGVKGEIKVYPLTDDIKRFRKVKRVFIDGVEKQIIWCKLQADKVILKIESIDTIEEAQKYRNKYIDIPREEAVRLREGEFFIADLLGCTVRDENGFVFGKIDDVIQTGSNDVYWVKGANEVLVPALKDVVVSINIENREIIIKPLVQWQW